VRDDRLTRFRRAYWRAFRKLDWVRLRVWEQSRVTLPQLRVLSHLERRPLVTTGELSRALGITVSTTSGLVIKLAERGLIERLTVADDRRQAPLRLTEEGVALLGDLSEASQAFTGEVARLLGDDLSAVTASLERLAEAASLARSAVAGEETGLPAAVAGEVRP
jgi:DNA-binding MarR family transcriptional regulator